MCSSPDDNLIYGRLNVLTVFRAFLRDGVSASLSEVAYPSFLHRPARLGGRIKKNG